MKTNELLAFGLLAIGAYMLFKDNFGNTSATGPDIIFEPKAQPQPQINRTPNISTVHATV